MGTDRPDDTTELETLAAAIEVFRTHGFVAASIQRLVDATGRSRSSLYNRFGDKDGLFVAALEHYISDVLPGTDGGTFASQLRKSLDALEAEAGTQPCLLARSCAEMADLPAKAVPLVENALEAQWNAMIDSPTAAGDMAKGTLGLAVRHGLSALAAAGVPRDILFGAIDELHAI